jgi:hypothetical protein
MLTTIGSSVACCGLLFFLICAGLVFWYLIVQKPMLASKSAPEPPIQATIEHPTAASESPKSPGDDV